MAQRSLSTVEGGSSKTWARRVSSSDGADWRIAGALLVKPVEARAAVQSLRLTSRIRG